MYKLSIFLLQFLYIPINFSIDITIAAMKFKDINMNDAVHLTADSKLKNYLLINNYLICHRLWLSHSPSRTRNSTVSLTVNISSNQASE